MTIYVFIVLEGVLIWGSVHFGTAYLTAKQHAKIARAALAAGREDIARELLGNRRNGLQAGTVRLFLPKDLKEKLLPAGRKAE